MKKAFLFSLLTFVIPFLLMAQPQEATLLGQWHDPGLTPTSWLDGRYNDIWGYAFDGKEYAIVGSTEGVHFIDVTDPETAGVLPDAFVPGESQGSNLVHRDYHSFQNYLYTVADEGVTSTLQIIDMSGLPDSTELVYSEQTLLRTTHNIFIDEATEKLYAFGGALPGTSFSCRIISLEDPVNPQLIASYPNVDFYIPYSHDGYVRNDTAYLNCGNNGFYVVDFTDPLAPNLLGTMTSYEQSGYNHSGWLTEDGRYYILADETHGKDLKVVDVQDFTDIHVVNTFNADSPDAATIPHNLIVKGDYLYVAYYYEGLQVFDISDPVNPERVYYYDTFDDPNDASYRGAWGVYPFLPSGNILLSDMQNGFFYFENIDQTATFTNNPQGIVQSVQLAPNPAGETLNLAIQLEKAQENVKVDLIDLQGRQVYRFGNEQLSAQMNRLEYQLPGTIPSGLYFIRVQGPEFQQTLKLTIQK